MKESNYSSPEGLWDSLEELESIAKDKLSNELTPFRKAFKDCYEAGVQAPTLSTSQSNGEIIHVSALFLKRTLNDLRGTWLLTNIGYTSQAASVAASLYESAMIVSRLSLENVNSQVLSEISKGNIPWKPMRLAKKLSDIWQKESLDNGEPYPDSQKEQAWREVYSAYKWLCKIKHLTIESAKHDAPSTSIKYGSYVVMAVPDLRGEDLPVKAMILTIALARCNEAIKRFALALEPGVLADYNSNFWQRLDLADKETGEAFNKVSKGSLPFTISDSELAKQWRINKIKGA